MHSFMDRIGFRTRCFLITLATLLLLFKSSSSDKSKRSSSECRKVIIVDQSSTQVSTSQQLFPYHDICDERTTTQCLLTYKGAGYLKRTTMLCAKQTFYFIRCKEFGYPTVTISSKTESRKLKCATLRNFEVCANPNEDIYVLFESNNANYICPGKDARNYYHGDITIYQRPAYHNTVNVVSTHPCTNWLGGYKKTIQTKGTITSVYRPDWTEKLYFCDVAIQIRDYQSRKLCFEFIEFSTFRGGAMLYIYRDGTQQVMFSAEHSIPESKKLCLKVYDDSEVKIRVKRINHKPHTFIFKYYTVEDIQDAADDDYYDDDDDDDDNKLYILFVIPGLVVLGCCGWCCKYCCKDDDDDEVAATAVTSDPHNRPEEPVDTESHLLQPLSAGASGFDGASGGSRAASREELRAMTEPSAPPPPVPSFEHPPSYDMLFPGEKNNHGY